MSPAQARATVGPGRDLDTRSTRVADAWLAGHVRGGSIRDLTQTPALAQGCTTDTREM